MANSSLLDHNATRRAVKQRQRARARANAIHKRETGEFSIAEINREKRNRQRRISIAKKKSHDNGDRLITKVDKQGVLRLSLRGYDDPERWVLDCEDVIKAAKRSEKRYVWNDWVADKMLLIAVSKD